MGLFFGKKKKGRHDADAAPERIEYSMSIRTSSAYEQTPEEIAEREEWERRQEERRLLEEEGRMIRKEKVTALGVDPNLFCEGRIRKDAFGFLEDFTPSYRGLRANIAQATISGDYQNLTKTGKLPKNVYAASLVADEPSGPDSKNDSIIVHMKYLRDGTVNMADIHLWHARVRHGVSIRQGDDGHRITFIDRYDSRTDVSDTLYLESEQQGLVDPGAILAESMGSTLLI